MKTRRKAGKIHIWCITPYNVRMWKTNEQIAIEMAKKSLFICSSRTRRKKRHHRPEKMGWKKREIALANRRKLMQTVAKESSI